MNAADFGFSPEASGIENAKALQPAVELKVTITVSKPAIYKMAGTVYIGSNTSLIFGKNVFLKKVDEQGAFIHVFVNAPLQVGDVLRMRSFRFHRNDMHPVDLIRDSSMSGPPNF